MSEGNYPQHYVCTHQQARELVNRYSQFWLGTCGCRASGKGCERSSSEVCLTFSVDATVSHHHHRNNATQDEVERVLEVAEKQHLVSRPFRNMTNKELVEGICHCCDDCCTYFRERGEICDKGSTIEETDTNACNDCGKCINVCYFGARTMTIGKLTLERESCYGCGLCVDVCPGEAIMMVPRSV
jgi:NAD-dependent dihydropyrimidine dehydrogenase PreA subunit